MEEFIEQLQSAFKELANKRAQELMEADPEKYITGTTDCGYYNNGVGFAPCSDKEYEYDEDRAYEDAVEELSIDIANGSNDFETAIKLFVDNNKLTSALAQYLRG